MESILPPEIKPEFSTYWKGPFDGRKLNASMLKGYGFFRWKIDSDNQWWNRPLKKGEIGCAISHWQCWRRANKNNDQLILILEDDVCFVDNFWCKLQFGLTSLTRFVPEWDLLYLGRVRIEPDTPAFDGIIKPGYSHCTFAYILTQSGIYKILQTSFEKAIIPVDEFLPAMYIDHPRADVRKRYPKRLSAYAFEPPIVLQLPKSIAGSDTEDSDFYEFE